jgi:hypothetical protein
VRSEKRRSLRAPANRRVAPHALWARSPRPDHPAPGREATAPAVRRCGCAAARRARGAARRTRRGGQGRGPSSPPRPAKNFLLNKKWLRERARARARARTFTDSSHVKQVRRGRQERGQGYDLQVELGPRRDRRLHPVLDEPAPGAPSHYNVCKNGSFDHQGGVESLAGRM